MTSLALTGSHDNQPDHDQPSERVCDNKILNIEYVPRFAIVLHCIVFIHFYSASHGMSLSERS